MNRNEWARRIVEAIPKEVRDDLADEPGTAIELHFPLTVQEAVSFEQRGAGGWCDGMSIIEGGVILYRRTTSRRQNFTLAHELAHHLVAEDVGCLSWLADQPDPPRLLEQLCDQIAASILIRESDLRAALGSGPVSADALARLYRHTSASRSACATAMAQRLPCDGFILLIEDGSDQVFYAARAHDTRPYGWKGDTLPTAHPLRHNLPGSSTATWWPYPVGGERRSYYMSTTVDDGWIFAVFAEHDLWGVERLHLPQEVDPGRRYDGDVICPSPACGYRGSTPWWPCPTCGQPRCPRCQECECDRRERREKRSSCRNCYASVREHLLEDGLCDNCR